MIEMEDAIFTEVQDAGDGNCLFRGISVGVYGHPEAHAHLRDELTNYVASNWAVFEADNNVEYDSVEAYGNVFFFNDILTVP